MTAGFNAEMRPLTPHAPAHFDDRADAGYAAKLRDQAQRCRTLAVSVASQAIAKTFIELARAFEARAAALTGEQNEHAQSHRVELHVES